MQLFPLFLFLGSHVTAQSVTETVLHSFAGTPSDGANPFTGLISDSAGNLYGTTFHGGANNLGTIFKLDTSNNLTVLHSFAGTPSDGGNPGGPVILDSAGNLYGTTYHGGANNLGTIFKLDTSNNLMVLHSFSGPDGAMPSTWLIFDSAGNLYGTTSGRGANNQGTIFKLNTSNNNFTVLYNFGTSTGNGANITGGLVFDAAGNLYGTTLGGSGNCAAGGCGTVFKLDTSNKYTLLHSFSGPDGDAPVGLIIDGHGNLYSTTLAGGANGAGNIFKLDTNNNFTVLYSFTTQPTAAFGRLIMDGAGNLYGTTFYGGSTSTCAPYSCGTVFKLDTSNAFTTLYSFGASPTDGVNPIAGLIFDSAGNLYGTTRDGGGTSCPNLAGPGGCGAVFKLALSSTFTPPTTSCLVLNLVQNVPLAPVTMTASGGVGGTYTFTANGLPPGITISSSGILSGTPTSSGTFNYTVTVSDSVGNKGTVTCSVTVAPPLTCTIPNVTISNTSWNSFNIPNGTSPLVVWVNAHIGKPSGVSTTTKTIVQFTGASLTLNGVPYPLPNGVITFDPSASTTPTTTFTSGAWATTVNPKNLSDEIFLLGAAIPVTPAIAAGANANFTFNVLSGDPTLSFQWQWGAAVYTYWPADWNQALILPYHNSDHAGTPENPTVQKSLIQGPRGGGGSNYTGSWSATGTGSCPSN